MTRRADLTDRYLVTVRRDFPDARFRDLAGLGALTLHDGRLDGSPPVGAPLRPGEGVAFPNLGAAVVRPTGDSLDRIQRNTGPDRTGAS